jgi:hypothetical protein
MRPCTRLPLAASREGGSIDPYPSMCPSSFEKQQEDEFVGSVFELICFAVTVNAESIRRGTNSIRND